MPGYSYYYAGEPTEHIIHPDANDPSFIDTVYTPNDTVLAGGAAIFGSHLSYRFPLYPGTIDKKIAFIYLDKLYGAVNGGAVLTANSGSEMLKMTSDDWLFFAGAELRLSTIAFNTYPMAVKLRWDQGFERIREGFNGGQPIGGARFTFALGFEFDNWTIVEEPDGLEERFTPAYMK